MICGATSTISTRWNVWNSSCIKPCFSQKSWFFVVLKTKIHTKVSRDILAYFCIQQDVSNRAPNRACLSHIVTEKGCSFCIVLSSGTEILQLVNHPTRFLLYSAARVSYWRTDFIHTQASEERCCCCNMWFWAIVLWFCIPGALQEKEKNVTEHFKFEDSLSIKKVTTDFLLR